MQLGPEGVAMGVKLNKALGLSHADVAAVFRTVMDWGSTAVPCRARGAVGQRGEVDLEGLRDAARRSLGNGVDETGSTVEAQLRWLWVVSASK